MQTHFLKTPDGVSLFVRCWTPLTASPKGIVHIVHGMCEHSARYSEFAEFLVSHGFYVTAHDHRGHGFTAQTRERLGHFADQQGWSKAVNDVSVVDAWIRQEYPHIPFFLLGHSMGSFIVQDYITGPAAKNIRGVILSGSDGPINTAFYYAASLLARLERWRLGPKTPSKLLLRIVLPGNSYDWLSRDPQVVARYMRDPLCGFAPTPQFWSDLLGGLHRIAQRSLQQKIPKTLPILLISGTKDPVGKYGHGIKRLFQRFKDLDFKDITLKLYPQGRHEMLNEINKKEVWNQILDWLESKT